MKNLKVYGGSLFAYGEQVRVIIAANSKNQVAKRLGETHYMISRMWGETGNEVDIARAKSKPLQPIVTVCLSRNERNYSLKELQEYVDDRYTPKIDKRPYVRRGK